MPFAIQPLVVQPSLPTGNSISAKPNQQLQSQSRPAGAVLNDQMPLAHRWGIHAWERLT